MSAGDVIEVSDEGAVRLIAFDRPQVKNAFNVDLYRATTSALADATTEESVHAVVLTGRGSAFSSGQDLREMAEIVAGTGPPGIEKGFRGMLDAVAACTKPLLAAVNGPAIGLGFTVLAHCDLVLVAESARLRVPFAELGVPAEAASSYLFPARMGWQEAARLLLLSEWITGKEAVQLGLALRVCPDDLVLGETMEIARRIAAMPADAVREIKRLMWAAYGDAVTAARAREDDAFRRMIEAMAARGGGLGPLAPPAGAC